jgi:hypothetical protein
MKPDFVHQQFEIVSFTWDTYSQVGKQKLTKLLRTDEKTAYNFCNLYFNRFDLIHKLGHIFVNTFNPDKNIPLITQERYANLFAIKYFQYKNENAYLTLLGKWFSLLLKIYNVSFDYNQINSDSTFEKYRKDIITYAATHFYCIQNCLNDPETFEDIIIRIGHDKLTEPNKGIILRPGINGQDLLYECIFTIFEMNYAYPEITIDYKEETSLDNIEHIRLIS